MYPADILSRIFPLHINPRNSLLFGLFVLAVAGPLQAHDNTLYYNQISLDASASAEVDNDTMIVSMYSQHESQNAKEASARVNEKINWAIAEAKKDPSVEIKTESYSTSPVYNKSQVVGWRVRQSITLKSRDMTALSELLGTLQRKINLGSVGFDVSRDARETYTEQLIDQALDAFQLRAEQVSDNLKTGKFRIVNMNISTSGSEKRRPYMAMRAMAAESAAYDMAPQTEGGKSTLTVRVSGTIELQE